MSVGDRVTLPPAPEPGGPYIACAVVCDSAWKDDAGLWHVDGVCSSLVARITGDGSDEAEIVETLAIILRPGTARGSHMLEAFLRAPSGVVAAKVEVGPLPFDDDADLVGFAIPLHGWIRELGLHHWDVYLDGSLLVRVPVRYVSELPSRLN